MTDQMRAPVPKRNSEGYSWDLRPGDPYEAYRTVAHKLAKYPADQIVAACLPQLHAGDEADIVHYPPWLLLLLIKWAIRDGVLTPRSGWLLNDRDFRQLINRMHDFDAAASTASLSIDNLDLAWRRMACQQFPLQQTYALAGLARQYHLFGHLPKGHSFSVQFHAHASIEVREFCELSLALTTRCVLAEGTTMELDWFDNLRASYPPGVVEGFLAVISRDWRQTKAHVVAASARRRNVVFELYERSPLWEFPLLLIGQVYVCYSPMLLYDRLQYFVYHTLRESGPDRFMGTFGNHFCMHVAEGVEALALTAYTEKDLIRIISSNTKVVDFVVEDGEANVLIEAKGVELPSLAKLSLDAGLVRDKLKPSVLKAIRQGYSTLNTLREQHLSHGLQSRSENYLLIVTYEQMYLSNGVFTESILGLAEDWVASTDREQMPLEHIYTISIDEFDALVGVLCQSGRRLVDVLRQAVHTDADPVMKKLLFAQHVEAQFGTLEVPPYLRRQSDVLTELLRARFGAAGEALAFRGE